MKPGRDSRQTLSGSETLPLPRDLLLPCGMTPYHDSNKFVGRQAELSAINEEMSPQNQKCHKLCTILGLGGVGKSKLALQYAKNYERQFYATLWISSQNAISIGQSFTNIALALQLRGAENGGNVDENIRLVFGAIQQRGSFLIQLFVYEEGES